MRAGINLVLDKYHCIWYSLVYLPLIWVLLCAKTVYTPTVLESFQWQWPSCCNKLFHEWFCWMPKCIIVLFLPRIKIHPNPLCTFLFQQLKCINYTGRRGIEATLYIMCWIVCELSLSACHLYHKHTSTHYVSLHWLCSSTFSSVRLSCSSIMGNMNLVFHFEIHNCLN